MENSFCEGWVYLILPYFYYQTHVILGTLAYRSLKRTKLGIREQSALRRVGELLALIAAAIPTILMLVNNPAAKFLIATDPVPWIIAPVWSYVAYLILWL